MKLGKQRDGDGEETDKQIEFDAFRDYEPMPTPPVQADGGPNLVGYLGTPDPIPAATPENFICLAGPCIHYLEIHSLADVETRGHKGPPKQINRLCRVIPGIEIDLTEDVVFGCSEWAPRLDSEAEPMNARRHAYRQKVLVARMASRNHKEGK